MARSLYICYFGVREALVQTQVLPYLRELVKGGHEISLLTFEPGGAAAWADDAVVEMKRELREQGIDWERLTYHKRFSVLATAYDIFRGAIAVRRMIGQKRLDILHARVHVPALMGAIARKLSSGKPKLLFDIRGFMLEEYTDAGVWPEGGWLYRAGKRIERWLMNETDGFVVLTEAARNVLFPESKSEGFDSLSRPVEVIPCCVDLERFSGVSEESRREMRERLGVTDRRVVTYVGSFGGWYLSDDMMKFFAAARKYDPNVFVLVLTQRGKEKVAEDLARLGFGEGDFLVESVRPADIARYLNAADLALSFIKPCYSKLSSSPTKLAEYLACGLPIISNRGVGDVDELITDNRVGVMVDGLSEDDYLKALRDAEALGDLRDHCREVSSKEFELGSVAGERYRRLYARLNGSSGGGKVAK